MYSWFKRNGVLLSEGRNFWGKEAYDLSRAVDVLVSLPEVDANKIGAIGHSAGANVMSFFVFFDSRVKASVANCGTSEINSYWEYNRREDYLDLLLCQTVFVSVLTHMIS